MKRQEVNCITGEVTDIPLTADEIADYEKRIEDEVKAIADAEAKAIAQASARTVLLAKLGITADEAKLLLS